VEFLMTALRRAERWGNGCAVLIMALIMAIVVADVALRYAFNRPLAWAYDFISLYLMAGLFYFVLSSSYESRSLVNIDMLYERFSPKGKVLARLVTNLSSIVFFMLIGYTCALRTYEELMAQEVVGGVIPWPTWISAATVTIGAVLLVARMAIEILDGAAQLSGRRPIVAETANHHFPETVAVQPPAGSTLS
jgi:TRAP-type C4-dicarboxylate transport system permease small subunit